MNRPLIKIPKRDTWGGWKPLITGEPTPPQDPKVGNAINKANEKITYSNSRVDKNTYHCDICGRTKQEIHVFKNDDDKYYLSCTVCERP